MTHSFVAEKHSLFFGRIFFAPSEHSVYLVYTFLIAAVCLNTTGKVDKEEEEEEEVEEVEIVDEKLRMECEAEDACSNSR